MVRIGHLSDPHFGAEDPDVKAPLLLALKALPLDVVLLTGDITQRASRAQFEDAQAFLSALQPTPVLVLPGNHDIPLFNLLARLATPYRHYEATFGNAVNVAAFTRKGVRILGFNSTTPWRHKAGVIDTEAVAVKLTEVDSDCALTILACHHPLDCRQAIDEANLLLNAGDLMDQLAASRVDMVVGGHIHDPYTTTSARRYPRLHWSMVLAVAGTCLSTRTRRGAPNSFNVITCGTDPVVRLDLERWDKVHERFECIATRRFLRDSARGWAEEAVSRE